MSGEQTIGYVYQEVVNTQGFVLPTTGGMGTAAFAAVGVVLIGGGAALFVSMKKRNAER